MWAAVVRPDEYVLVRDQEVDLPRAGLDVRGAGVWVGLDCEEPLQRWSVGLEAFGVALAEPADALTGERGDRRALGFDLEWEGEEPVGPLPWDAEGYQQACIVHGEVLLGEETLTVTATGHREHGWGVPDWSVAAWSLAGRRPSGEAVVEAGWGEEVVLDGIDLAPVAVAPLVVDGDGGAPVASVVRTLHRLSAPDDAGTGLAWSTLVAPH